MRKFYGIDENVESSYNAHEELNHILTQEQKVKEIIYPDGRKETVYKPTTYKRYITPIYDLTKWKQVIFGPYWKLKDYLYNIYYNVRFVKTEFGNVKVGQTFQYPSSKIWYVRQYPDSFGHNIKLLYGKFTATMSDRKKVIIKRW